MKERRYQEEVILSLMEAREEGAHRALVVMAPSLGKTVVAALDAKYYLEENPGRVLYLCNTNEVLNQAKKTFKKVFGDEYSYGLYNAFKKAKTTDFLFASFQTMRIRKSGFSPEEFSYIIIDEAHHAPAKTFYEVQKYFRPDFLLGLTATPHRLDGLDLNEIFGETVYTMDLPNAIAKGLVANVDYRLMLDDLQLSEKIEVDGQSVSISKLNRRLFVPKRDEEIVRLIKEKLSLRKNPRTMIFCQSVEHANNIASLMGDAAVVTSEKSMQENLKQIQRFRKGEISTIVSVNQLNEGVDIPQADVVVFLRSTVSSVVYYQQLGRGLRTYDGKEDVLVLDFVANCERIMMVNELQKQVQEARNRSREEGSDEEERFILNVDNAKFEEAKIKIVEILERNQIFVTGYDKDELIEKLRNKAKELGRTPMRSDVNQDSSMSSATTYEKYFGGWNNALKTAGLKLNRDHTDYDEEILIESLKRLRNKLQRVPYKTDLTEYPLNAYQKAFGTWDKALSAAGMRSSRHIYTDQELLDIIREKFAQKGKMSYYAYVNDPDMPDRAVFSKRFGSFRKALEKAGISTEENEDMYRKELIDYLQRLNDELGRTPCIKDLKDPKYPYSVFSKLFGGWRNAMLAAGMRSSRHIYTDEELIELLKEKYAKDGKIPTKRAIMNDPEMPNDKVFSSRFGGLGAALKAAGLVS